LNNNNRSSILDRSFTRSPGVRYFYYHFLSNHHSFQQSQAAAAAATQQARALQEDLFKVQYELDDFQHKYGGLEKSYNELSKSSLLQILSIHFLLNFQRKKIVNYPKKFFDKLITIQSKMNVINFVKIFIDLKRIINGKKNFFSSIIHLFII
jgi:hypothetical protein